MSTSMASQEKKGDVCPHQIAFLLDNRIRRLFQSPKKIVGSYLKKGDTALDVGCGPGFFSIDMAKMVGRTGKVIAADLQTEMLEKVKKKARKHGVLERMTFHQCRPTSIGLTQTVDFILAYYMIHETPNPKALLAELKRLLNPGGTLLVVEPKLHVNEQIFNTLLTQAGEVGLVVAELPRGKGGRSVLFR